MKLKPRTTTDYIIIHNAATSPSMTDVDAEVIDRWHRARGFLSCGYQVVITRSAEVTYGRPMDAPGAHTKGFNHCSVGVCLAGGIAERPATPGDSKAERRRGWVPMPGTYENNFTNEQLKSLEITLLMLRGLYPDAKIRGHCDFASYKSHCPGFDLKSFLKERGLDN